MKNKQVHSRDVHQAAIQRLKKRGVKISDIADIVYQMQAPYSSNLEMNTCVESVEAVLEKREIQHAILVAVELDVLAEKGQLTEPLQSLVESDEGLFGCDETLALGSVLGYGSIAVTTFGHLDKQKIGIVKKLDTKVGSHVHTFLDDIVCGIAASASSRLAHRLRDNDEAEASASSDEQAG
ncbi:phosphatidylglycerophosphatase A [Caldalkalibacillus salinus]|uniref:phosphatidylglycerophosphatase A family protein n=1 Tax=Caldalkalibacillus salinus TaxID=2803787 RepID=UPI001922B85B|nr:phosphatidylglycerophosphatase A [Caldalkalibacillus salinus]